MKTKSIGILAIVLAAVSAFILLYLRTSKPQVNRFLDEKLDKPFVNDLELGCVKCDFKRYFVVKDAGVVRPFDPDFMVDLVSFNSHLQAILANQQTDDIGVIVHHGLREISSGNFGYFPEIEFAGLKDLGGNEWDLVPILNARYSLDPITGGLIAQDNIEEWALYKDHMHRYNKTADAMNDPNFNRAIPVVDNEDVQHYMFKYRGRIEKLLEQNADKRATHLKIVSIVEPLEHLANGMKGLRHHVSLVLVDRSGGGSGTELLDSESYWPQNYRMKALDVGSPCPYRCATAEFPKNGTPLRKSCTVKDNSCKHTPKHYNLSK